MPPRTCVPSVSKSRQKGPGGGDGREVSSDHSNATFPKCFGPGAQLTSGDSLPRKLRAGPSRRPRPSGAHMLSSTCLLGHRHSPWV